MLTLRLNLLSSKREDRLRHRYQIWLWAEYCWDVQI